MKPAMFQNVSMFVLALLLTVSIAAAQAVEIKMKDGSRWRGQVSDSVQLRYMQHGVDVPIDGKVVKIEPLYIVVEGIVAGVTKQVTVFKSDIVSMKTTESGSGAIDASDTSSTRPTPAKLDGPSNGGSASADKKPGVFVLPMEGMVGLTYRHQEVVKLGEYIDKNYGPGQTVVLIIDSGGGRADEMGPVHKAIMDLKKNHRVVAWIKSAISAAAASGSACDEIYFMTGGTLGAMTAFAGGVALQGIPLQRWMENAGELFEKGGRHRYVAWAMIEHHQLLSYDKDPVTGIVTWHNDLSGEFILSDDKSNLVFNASNALHCGFSYGTADTTDDLAKLMNLPAWHEVSDYGRKLAADWKRTCNQAESELKLLGPRLEIKNTGSGDPIQIIGTRIQLLNDAIRWWDRCPNVCELYGLPPKMYLEREVAELKKQLADMRRANR